MKKLSGVFAAFVIMAFLMGEATLSARAAEINTYDRLALFGSGRDESCYFNAERYAADYPDLYAAFGNDKKALWDHYKVNGVGEGRVVYGTTDEVNAKLRVYDVAEEITDSEMSDREKVKVVHDWIVNHTSYDSRNNPEDTIPDESYEMEGVMLRGTAVCSGYARTFEYFMYVFGIEQDYISGVAVNSAGETGRHAWNRVLIDGNWLYIDCTWDDPVSSERNILRYNYFLISEEEMSRDHAMQNICTRYESGK